MTRVYSYGTVPSRVAAPIGEDSALAQLRLANRLWNTLVAIERARMERYRAIMRDDAQERIDGLRERVAALRAEMAARRKQARTRTVEDVDLRAALDDA